MTSAPPAHPSRAPESFSEQRAFVRYALWFPVTLTTPEHGDVWAICRDASASGLLVSSIVAFPKGTLVEARFRVTPDPESAERIAQAEVVRVEMNDGDLVLAFPHRLALRFVTAIAELPGELATRVGFEPTP